MFERRLYYHIDWALLVAILALCALGVAMIYSTTLRTTSHMHITQLYAIVLGLGVMVLTLTLDYRTFTDKSHLIYLGLIALLVYVMFFGTVQMGARRRASIRRSMRKAPATSRSRRALRSVRAARRAKASPKEPRASCGSFRSPTTISFSRCWPRNRGLPASWWRSACIYS